MSWSAEARDPNKRALLPALKTPAVAGAAAVELDSSKSLGINIGDVEANDVVVEIDSA